MKKIYIAISCLLAGGIIGFFIGRNSIEYTTKIEYIKGETITGIVNSEPVKVENSNVKDLPERVIYRDTGRVVVVDNVIYKDKYLTIDTAALIEDYMKKRYYSDVLFDDNRGKLSIDLLVQHNERKEMSYEFTPIEKVITKTVEKTWTPFVGAGYNSIGNGLIYVEGGTFYKNLGVSATYMKTTNGINNSGYGISAKLSF